jgi:electron transfer flavoprotein beta subunit
MHAAASPAREIPIERSAEGMNTVVLVKQVPDTSAERTLDPADNTLDRASVDAVINEIDEYAIEEGMLLKEAHGGEVTVLTVGPQRATESIRKALSMGADKAVHVSDEAIHGSDALQTAKIIAKALGTIEYDVVIAGSEATDTRMSVLPALVAEALGVPQLSHARTVTVDGSSVTIERVSDAGYDVVQASMPVVISVVEKINEPRYPSFKGIMTAKSKPIQTLSVADLGLAADEVGLASATSQVVSFEAAPPRQAGQVVKDEGDGGVKIADFLASRKLI